MKRLILCAALAVSGGAALAADKAPADKPQANPSQTEAQQLSLTIYNSNLALVQDVRQTNVAAGRSRIEFKDVSASIKPETVALSGKGLSVVEQNFDYDLLTPAKMMEKAVGKQIQIVRTNPATGAQTVETATVLSVNSGVILRIGNRIEVLRDDGIPTRVVFSSIPENLRPNPTLSVTVDAASGGTRQTTLSYLTTGLSWNADYVALFDEKQGTLRLQGWITLTNKSGTTFRNAKAQLVAGDIRLSNNDQEFWQTQRATTRKPGTVTNEQASVADYYVYPVAQRVTVADNQTKQVGFLDLSGVKATKSYEFDASWFESMSDPAHVDAILKVADLAKAMPSGVVRVYMRDETGEPKFIGENPVGQVPAGSDLAIKTGQAFDVTAQGTLVSSEKISGARTRYAMTYAFHNARPSPAMVTFRQTGMQRNGKVESESETSTRVDASTLEWIVSVPANGDATLSFTVDAGG